MNQNFVFADKRDDSLTKTKVSTELKYVFLNVEQNNFVTIVTMPLYVVAIYRRVYHVGRLNVMALKPIRSSKI